MRFWWVNLGQTFDDEVFGGYLWSPMFQRDNTRLRSYEFMKELRVGDQVFAFSKGAIRAVGTVLKESIDSDNPFTHLDQWNREGWLALVDFDVTSQPFSTKNNFDRLAPLLPYRYSPLDKNGNGAQKLYLTEIDQPLAELLFAEISPGLPARPGDSTLEAEIRDLESLFFDSESQVTFREEMAKARIGQGVYKKRVGHFESACRITGMTDTNLLVASHIKPWSTSNDFERLDGHNGLLLSPHVDRLFDRGFISFKQNGSVIASPLLSAEVSSKWHLSMSEPVGRFTDAQEFYLEFHRDVVFQG